ncbi:MAG: pilus motility taxis protein HmpF [Synechococcales bacterium]|nr:pilus motility taxis protein HmpF [Synechococcales bacterium]
MLYLAEVQKKTRVIGGSKAEFKLLACQRAEHNWSPVGEELIPAPDDVPYNSGALVLVDLSGNRQVQRHSEAARQLVSILQNFSRLQEKSKTQEEEIEQWKQSLTYQSQELNRREIEMESRQEQLQQMEEDFEQLEQQRREIAAAREEANRLQEEFNRKNQELEGAWAHLQGEMRRFEERKAEIQQSSGLNDEQARHIQDLLNQLSNAVTPTAAIREHLDGSFEQLSHHQGLLDQRWHELEEQRGAAQQLQDEVDRQAGELQERWQSWHQAQEAWIQAQSDLKANQRAIAVHQETLQALSAQVHSQSSFQQQLEFLVDTAGNGKASSKLDIAALEQMPIEQLQSTVQELARELEKNSRFVSSQEEELTLQQQEIEKRREQVQQANESDRPRLEAELADEQESYRMLNETLVGQRRNLQEREMILKQHEAVLARRQGLPVEEGATDLHFDSVLKQFYDLQTQAATSLQQMEQALQPLQASVAEQEAQVSQQATELAAMRAEIQEFEQNWLAQKASAAELWGKVNLLQEMLQPIQDAVNGVREKLEAIATLTTQVQETSDHQHQAISEMQQTIQALSDQSPQLAAS